MMNYVRFSGKQYLLSTLSPLLAEIIELGNTLEVRIVCAFTLWICALRACVQIDPNKLAKGQDLAENMARYKRTCKRCFDAIIASLPAAPRYALSLMNSSSVCALVFRQYHHEHTNAYSLAHCRRCQLVP